MKLPCNLRVGRAAGLVLVVVLAACGGSPLDPDKFTPDFSLDWHSGSIALNPVTFEAGITANYPSQDEADAAAITTCGGAACSTVLRFSGAGVCGALARSTDRHVGVATGGSLDAARSQATAQCTARGGTDCAAGVSMCND
jgi:Domain of unknown function (DUF4189)